MKKLLLLIAISMITSLTFAQSTFRQLKKAINNYQAKHDKITIDKQIDTSKSKIVPFIKRPISKTVDSHKTDSIPATKKDTSSVKNAPKANADFTLPDVGQKKINLILNPSFSYNKSYSDSRFGVTGHFWGNTIGTDSSLQTIGNKFLIPQASMIGTKVDVAWILYNSANENIKFGPVGEVNFLWKKVSYADTIKADATAGKLKSDNFTPFVIHSKVGFTVGFFDANVLITGYLNYLWVTSENVNFNKFFNTNKSFLIYPEINTTMAFDLGDSKNQTIKVGIDMIYNNSDAQILSNSHDKIIPYLKVGLASNF